MDLTVPNHARFRHLAAGRSPPCTGGLACGFLALAYSSDPGRQIPPSNTAVHSKARRARHPESRTTYCTTSNCPSSRADDRLRRSNLGIFRYPRATSYRIRKINPGHSQYDPLELYGQTPCRSQGTETTQLAVPPSSLAWATLQKVRVPLASRASPIRPDSGSVLSWAGGPGLLYTLVRYY